ncbi:MAG: hypothetical protein IPL78_32395 [Chloroflexi bacterium]|nr:hypothetical protein [Chloroflexota bacterium]
MKPKSEKMGVGIALSGGIGIALGLALNNMFLGYGLGIAIGLILGFIFSQQEDKSDSDDEA